MAALTVDSGPTPADYMAAQIITDCGNFTLDFKQHGCCASPLFLQTLGPWFTNEMQHLLSSEKRTLDDSPVLFLLSPGKKLLMLSLVQKWLGSPFPEDVWAWWLLMNSLQLQFTLCEALQCLNHLCLTVKPSLLLEHLFLPTFFLPVNFAFNILYTAFLEQPHLSVMTLCDLPSLWRVSMIVSMIMYCVDGH